MTPLLTGWVHQPGSVSVRLIGGDDGRPKLQMRLDLGLLQMETVGRPDGQRPHGCDSLLDYHQTLLAAHRARHRTTLGFSLTPTDCQRLREEAGQVYHRYLAWFVLEEFDAVLRDTSRNLRILELCGRFAEEDADRLAMEAHRPYLVMMQTRALSATHLRGGDPRAALRAALSAVRRLRRHYARFGGRAAFRASGEARVLRQLARELRARVPQSPLRKLARNLRRAVRREDYETAATLRDALARAQS